MASGKPSALMQSQVVRECFPELPSFRMRMFQQTIVRGNLGNPTPDTAVQSPATTVLSKEQQSNPRKTSIGIPLPVATYNQHKKPSNCVLHSGPCLTEQQCKTLQSKQRAYNMQEPAQIFQGSQSYLQQIPSTNFQSNPLNQDSTMQSRNNKLNSQQSSLYQEPNISSKRHKSENLNEANPNTRFQKLQIHAQSQQHSAQHLNDQQINSHLNRQNCQSGAQLQQTSSSSQTQNKNLPTQSHEQYTSRDQCQQTSPEPETRHSSDQQSNNQPTQHIPSTAQQYLQAFHPQHVRLLPFYYGAFCPIQPQHIPQYYSPPYYSQTLFQHPLCYQPTMQQIQFPQAVYQPHETRWNIPQNIAMPTTIVNGPQRVESLNPVHVVSRASGGIQNFVASYPTVPRSNHIQLYLDKPKVINLHSSMLSQTSLPVSATYTDCTNKLQSSDSDQICQRSIPAVSNSNVRVAAVQTEETPTCSKYLQPEAILPVSRNDSSFSTNTMNLKQIKNSISESSVSQEHKNDVSSVEMQPVDKISNNESNKTRGKQPRFNMETITEDIILPILSPVLWNSSGMAHPLKAAQNKTSEKREHTPQNEKIPSKKRSKK